MPLSDLFANRDAGGQQQQGGGGPRTYDMAALERQANTAADPDSAKYKIAVALAQDSGGADSDEALKGIIDDYFAQLNPTEGVDGRAMRGENGFTDLIAAPGRAVDAFNEKVGEGLDWFVDRGADLAGWLTGDDSVREAGYNLTDGKSLSWIPSVAEDIGLAMIPGVGLGLAAGKGLMDSRDQLAEALGGHDVITGDELDGGQRLIRGGAALGNAALAAMPGMGLNKSATRQIVESASERAEKAAMPEAMENARKFFAGRERDVAALQDEGLKAARGVKRNERALEKAADAAKVDSKAEKAASKQYKAAENEVKKATEELGKLNDDFQKAFNEYRVNPTSQTSAAYSKADNALQMKANELRNKRTAMQDALDNLNTATAKREGSVAVRQRKRGLMESNMERLAQAERDVTAAERFNELIPEAIERRGQREAAAAGARAQEAARQASEAFPLTGRAAAFTMDEGLPFIGRSIRELPVNLGNYQGSIGERIAQARNAVREGAAARTAERRAQDAAIRKGREEAAGKAAEQAGEEATKKSTVGNAIGRLRGRDMRDATFTGPGSVAGNMLVWGTGLLNEGARGDASNFPEIVHQYQEALDNRDFGRILPAAIGMATPLRTRVTNRIGAGSTLPYYALRGNVLSKGVGVMDEGDPGQMSDEDRKMFEALLAGRGQEAANG